MGADMLAALLLAPADFTPDWEAGHSAIDALVFTDQDSWALDTLFEDWDDHLDDKPDDWDPKPTLHKIVDELKGCIYGREVTTHIFGEICIFIAGGMSWGDPPDACRPMWGLGEFPEVLKAIGFLPDVEIKVKEKA